MEHAMANCPSAVAGAATAMRAIDGGVVLDITAADPAAARAIAERAHRDVTLTPPDPARGEHSGAHGGPGDAGHCPVVHVGTTVTVEDIAGGARITVRTTDPTQAAALERETRERIEWLDPSTRPR
jgi:TusA-related sulfurtransferase